MSHTSTVYLAAADGGTVGYGVGYVAHSIHTPAEAHYRPTAPPDGDVTGPDGTDPEAAA